MLSENALAMTPVPSLVLISNFSHSAIGEHHILVVDRLWIVLGEALEVLKNRNKT